MRQALCVPDSAVSYILFQRTQYLRFPRNRVVRLARKVVPSLTYEKLLCWEASVRKQQISSVYDSDMREEYASLKDHLPETCTAALDIGCGVAGIDVFLQRHFGDTSVKLFLLDKSHTEEKVFYEFHERGAFYNSLETAKDLLVSSGVPESNITLLEANEANEILIEQKLDLVVSLISWGFHYPVSTYLDRVHDLLSDKGVVVLDVRKGTDGLEALTSKFADVEIVSEQPKSCRVVCRK